MGGLSGWGFVQPINEMQDGQAGVVKEHARSGKAHHLADLFAPVGLVAMDGALGTGGLVCPIGTALDAAVGISRQIQAIEAQAGVVGLVMSVAVERDHLADGLLRTVQTVIDHHFLDCGVVL